jgi:hypothetical protein
MIEKLNRDQTALRSALDAAHRVRDARVAKAHARKLTAKNWRDARAPTREELFAAQLATFRTARPDLRKVLDEMHMASWRNAKGAGLRDW